MQAIANRAANPHKDCSDHRRNAKSRDASGNPLLEKESGFSHHRKSPSLVRLVFIPRQIIRSSVVSELASCKQDPHCSNTV